MEEGYAKGAAAVSKEDLVTEEGVSSSATDCQRRLSTRKLKRVGILTRKVSWCNVEIMINNNECMINNKKQVILRAIFLGCSIVMKKC